jgi:hypothetical protein
LTREFAAGIRALTKLNKAGANRDTATVTRFHMAR